MSNIDPRGIKRGRCLCDDCDEYMASSKMVECNYCGCFPSKHMKLDEESVMPLNVNSLENVNKLPTDGIVAFNKESSFDNSTESVNKEITDDEHRSEISEKEDDSESEYSNLPENIQQDMKEIENLIPNNFNDDFNNDIMTKLYADKELERKNFCKIVRLIADKMIEAHRTLKNDVLQAAIVATNKFPGLKGATGMPHRRFEKRLKTTLKNKRSRATKSKKTNLSQNEKENECTLNKSLELLTEESGKTVFDSKKIKKLLGETRKQRQEDAKILPAKEMLQKYKILQESKYILWEFAQLVDMTLPRMTKNLEDGIQKLLKIIPTREQEIRDDMFVLKNLHTLFKSGQTNTKKNKRKLLEIVTDEEEAVKVATTDRAPFLIIFNEEASCVKCYVDSEPFFVEKAKKAIMLLMAIYWVFDIDFDKDFQVQLILLASIIFGSQTNRILNPYGLESLTVSNILQKAGF